MTAKIRFLPSGHEFIAQKTESILEAALRSGLSPRYSCDKGSCGECKARLVSGQITKHRFHDYTITEAEKAMGFVLLCSITADSDLVIETIEAGGVEDMPLQQVMARVTKIERINEDIIVLYLRTPRTRTLRFLAGQHARLAIEKIPPRALSIASCPCNAMNLQFHVSRYDDDAFSQYVFTELKAGQTVPLQGPLGEFVMVETSSRPIIFIAYETGFAPIKSLIEHAISLEVSQAIHLFWVARRQEGHYMDNLCRSWVDALDNFSYSPLVQDWNRAEAEYGENRPEGSTAQSQPHLRETFVMDSIMSKYPDLNGIDIYACGTDSKIKAIRDTLRTRGFPHEQLYSTVLHDL